MLANSSQLLRGPRRRLNLKNRAFLLRCTAACTLLCVLCAAVFHMLPSSSSPSAQTIRADQTQEEALLYDTPAAAGGAYPEAAADAPLESDTHVHAPAKDEASGLSEEDGTAQQGQPLSDGYEDANAASVSTGAADLERPRSRPLIMADATAEDGGAGAVADAAGAAVRALEEEGCPAVAQGLATHHLRVKRSVEPVPEHERAAPADADPTSWAEVDPATYKFPFRVPEVPGAREYGDVQWCPGSLEPPAEEVPAVDPAYRALFLIGAQKAGTTWLFRTLTSHPSVVFGKPAQVNRNNKHKGSVSKELQFFNSWPARSTEEFLAMWPPEELEAMRNGTSQKFLFDGSPEYLLNAAVAPRMKQMVPHAKIMVVLRDPTDRAFSAWGMKSGWGHYCDSEDAGLSQLCIARSFQAEFNAWHNSFARPECRFTTPGSDVSWGECYGCRYNLFQYSTCCELREQGQEGLFPCFGVPRGFSVVDYSAYAAQLAWWLEFFPPQQLFIVTSETLHDETKRIQVLNGLLDFVGLPDAPHFRAEEVNAASAFNGHYSNVSPEDLAAKAPVRRFHTPQVRDLHALLARFWPDVDTSALEQWPKADEDR